MSSEKLSMPEMFVASLADVMKKKNLKQYQVAEMAGIPRGRMSEYISGKRYPSYATIEKITYAVGENISPMFNAPELPNNKTYQRLLSESVDAYTPPSWLDDLTPRINRLDKETQNLLKATIEGFLAGHPE